MIRSFAGDTTGRFRPFGMLGMAVISVSCSEAEQELAPESTAVPREACESKSPSSALDSDDRLAEFLAKEKFYSAGNEELLVRHFFKDRRDGVFLAVGCYHWFQFSVTSYLETRLGWSGVAVDALPFFENGWKKNRKKSTFYQYAVTDKSGEELTFYPGAPGRFAQHFLPSSTNTIAGAGKAACFSYALPMRG